MNEFILFERNGKSYELIPFMKRPLLVTDEPISDFRHPICSEITFKCIRSRTVRMLLIAYLHTSRCYFIKHQSCKYILTNQTNI